MSDVQIKIVIDSKTGESNLKKVESIGVQAAQNISKEFDKSASGINSGSKSISLGINNVTSAWSTFQGMVASQVVLGGINKVASAITNSFKGIVEAGSDFEQVVLQFQNITGSAEEAYYIINQIRDIDTLIDEDALASSVIRLTKFGISAKNAVETVKVLGDVGVHSGKNIGEMTELLISYNEAIALNGSMTTKQMKSLGAELPSVKNELEKMAVASGTTLNQALKDGSISADMFQKAMVKAASSGGEAFKAMEKQSKSQKGAWDNFRDTIKHLSQDIGMQLSPALTKIANGFKDIIEKNKKLIMYFAEDKIFGPFIDNMQKMIDVLSKQPEKVERVLQSFVSLGEAVRGFTDFIAEGIKGIDSLINFLDDLGYSVGESSSYISGYSTALTLAIISTVSFGKAVWAILAPLIAFGGWLGRFIALGTETTAVLAAGESALSGIAIACGQVSSAFSYLIDVLFAFKGGAAWLALAWPTKLDNSDDILESGRALESYTDKIKGSYTELGLFVSEQERVNEQLLKQSGILDIINGKPFPKVPYAPNSREPASADLNTNKASTGALTDEQKNTLDKLKEIESEIVQTKRDANLAMREDEVLYYNQSEELIENRKNKTITAIEEEQKALLVADANKLSALNAEQARKLKADSDEMKAYEKKQKRLAQIDIDSKKRHVANQRAVDSQLLAMDREFNQTKVNGAFALANTLNECAVSGAGTQFAIAKGLAIAQATVNAYMAASMALAQPPGPPWTIPVSELAFSMGMFNVAMIAATGMIQAVTGKYAEGGIVPGSSFVGDKVPAYVNSGEMILNKQQQSKLFEQINTGKYDSSNNEGIVSAIKSAISDIKIVLEADSKEIARAANRGYADGIAFGGAR